jgi:protein ImuB
MHWIALLPPEGEHTAWSWRALQFTPRVAQVDEALVLEVSASHRLWGGPDRLLRRLFRPNHASSPRRNMHEPLHI